MSDQRSRMRIEQSRTELTGLANEIRGWFVQRDFGLQYQTQLSSLQEILNQSLNRLAAELDKIEPTARSGLVYRQCRAADRRLVWVRRVWEYFASRFDQRLDPRYAAALKAAGEVVWACYAVAMRRVSVGDGQRIKKPVPLPYIEPQYSPRAFTRADLPPEVQANLLAQERLASLQELLGQMPVPVIGLPPSTVRAPWVLAFIAHEAGHHLAVDLREDGRLLPDFASWLYEISLHADRSSGRDPDEAAAAEWFNWADEVLADLYSVCCLGSAAVWAMAELENTDQPGMLASLVRYPAPAVRLGLLSEAAESLGLQDPSMLGGLEPSQIVQSDEKARDHLKRAGAVAKTVLASGLPGMGHNQRLPRLAGFKPEAFDLRKGRLAAWKTYFLDGKSLIPQKNLLETRLAAAGSVLAWRQAQELESKQRQDVIARMETEVPAALAATQEAGVRSAEEPSQADVTANTDALSSWLLDPRWEALEPL